MQGKSWGLVHDCTLEAAEGNDFISLSRLNYIGFIIKYIELNKPLCALQQDFVEHCIRRGPYMAYV